MYDFGKCPKTNIEEDDSMNSTTSLMTRDYSKYSLIEGMKMYLQDLKNASPEVAKEEGLRSLRAAGLLDENNKIKTHLCTGEFFGWDNDEN